VNAFLKDKDTDTAIRQLQDTYSRLQMQEVRERERLAALRFTHSVDVPDSPPMRWGDACRSPGCCSSE
jgi:hypothetical protein